MTVELNDPRDARGSNSARNVAQRALAFLILLVVTTSPLFAHAADGEPSPDWVEGYAAGTLRVEFNIEPRSIVFRDGTLSVGLLSDRRPQVRLDTLERALSAIPGVSRVELLDPAGNLLHSAENPAALPAEEDSSSEAAEPAASSDSRAVADEDIEIFPADKLFEPLGADPRWPRFSIGLGSYLNDTDLDNVAQTNFGLTLPLLRSKEADYGEFELGIQAGVFSIFDMDAASFDLINSDFIGAVFTSYRRDAFSAMLRFYHQSSHLGDEFLLRNRADRINLSFEVIDLLFSFDANESFRLYAGGGFLIHREPNLDRWLIQTGAQWESPKAFLSGSIRPLVNLDIQFREESNFNEDVSLQFGFQIENPRLKRIKIRLTGDYYRGRSPNGQFFVRRIQTIGGGVHLEL